LFYDFFIPVIPRLDIVNVDKVGEFGFFYP